MQILEEAMACWEAGRQFRKNRTRCKDFTFGRQWNEVITIGGTMMTESEYLYREGHIPLTNNLIHRIVRNITGLFRQRFNQLSGVNDEGKTEGDDAIMMEELYARSFEEFLISGMAVHKKWIGVRDGKAGVWTDMVSQNSFFYNLESRDFRGCDLEMVGEIHEIGFAEWCREMVDSRAGWERAKDIFSGRRHVKVVEVWRRERRPRYLVHIPQAGSIKMVEEGEYRRNTHLQSFPSKWMLHDVWRYYFIAEDGSVLAEGDSPYVHGSHPYVMRGYPFLDGEIHSLVADLIDQQKYTNRLITVYDWIMRSSAKGVLLVPETAIDPDERENVAEQWGRFDGVIVYRPKAGVPEPRQVNADCSNPAISELLEIQLKMLEDISGVNGALRGNLSSNSMSGTLFSQQTENALASLQDIFSSFASFMAECRRMDRALRRQTSSLNNK